MGTVGVAIASAVVAEAVIMAEHAADIMAAAGPVVADTTAAAGPVAAVDLTAAADRVADMPVAGRLAATVAANLAAAATVVAAITVATKL